MELEELKKNLRLKAFRSTVCGQVYRFVPGNMLYVNSISAPYEIRIDRNWFILDHNNLLGSESLVMEVETMKYPITITLFKRSNLDFFTTFIEE